MTCNAIERNQLRYEVYPTSDGGTGLASRKPTDLSERVRMNVVWKFFEYLSHDPVARAEVTAIALLILTALLLLLTYGLVRQDWAEISSWASIATIVVAIHFMIVGWRELAVAKANAATNQEGAGRIIKDCSDCPELVVIRSGLFVMGAGDAGATSEEGPPRRVLIREPFAIGVRPVSVREFAAFANATARPAASCQGGAGTETASLCVTWRDAVAYAAWLAARSGQRYRLASAAQWEYAARAGSAPPSDANQILAAPASLDEPNWFGVAGLAPGAGELVADCWSPNLAAVPTDGLPLGPPWTWDCSARVVRFSRMVADSVRFTGRRSTDETSGQKGVGFRVVRELGRAEVGADGSR